MSAKLHSPTEIKLPTRWSSRKERFKYDRRRCVFSHLGALLTALPEDCDAFQVSLVNGIWHLQVIVMLIPHRGTDHNFDQIRARSSSRSIFGPS